MKPAFKLAAAALLLSPLASLSAQDQPSETPLNQPIPNAPPIAEQREHSYSRHGITIADPYHWLKDQSYPVIDDPDVLAYLNAENAWFEAQMAPHSALVEELFQEMRGRIKEDDSTVPQKDGDWLYWAEYEAGSEYRKYYRRPVSGGEAQLYLDANVLAEGHEYLSINDISISRNGRYMAYSIDTDGSERYTVRIKDLETGDLLPDVIEETNTSLTWAANDTMLVYGVANENWRVDNVRVHRIGTDAAEDVEIYREAQLGFTVHAGLSGNEEWLILATGDNETSEVWLLPASDPLGTQQLVRARQTGVEYSVDVKDSTLFVHHNADHLNFSLATAPLANPAQWTTLIPGSDEFYLTGVDLFRDFYVTEGRLAGLDQVQVRYYDDPARLEQITFPEASYTAGLSNNPEWDMQALRLSYQSMITPSTVYDYHVGEQRLETLKVQEIPSGYDPSLYTVERLEIPARDGTLVPVSVVYRKDRQTGDNGQGGPLHLYAYGAYGYAVPPGFSTNRLSYVDRGMAYAIAHIRGGDDLGRRWYLQGKMEERTNTFNDFVDVARGLIALGYTTEGQISASGGSAGGELMGAVVNQAPELWGAVAAHVPFVDVLSTMLDESLPLTPGEWPEWGNPVESKAAFTHILSYSPYDQVTAQDYPPMLVTAGLNDPRVTYWEPAKWVAKLRVTKTDDNVLLLKTNMGAGHGGRSGRFESLREDAEEAAFILWQLGVAE
ncbi:S9 family peptidase [Altererythrobacter sp. KTW20L]|uniref:S9 family peptidase n=1 Tax=Altererythrobacter sp. KTW20L TaxID=2942210 RepID=UPI0020BE902E|nr:S9 family peptidase [Altererythrobacter sp. KTW20L]MCL6250162.1 S9 family peptidase [Altererythrobacter sp. KTW20L]